jgi:hypothetical protein
MYKDKEVIYYICKNCFHAAEYHNWKHKPYPCLVINCNCKKCIVTKTVVYGYTNKKVWNIKQSGDW